MKLVDRIYKALERCVITDSTVEGQRDLELRHAAEDVERVVERHHKALVDVCQRIRAGWLPHYLRANRSWWWGRPTEGSAGFWHWSEGRVPAMSVVERMKPAEVEAWVSTLHEHAPERALVEEGRDG